MHEHRIIERMIEVMDREVTSIAELGRTDPALIDDVTDFIHSYADRCHHGKEEDILFRRLEGKLTGPLAETMQGLVDDHAHARVLTGRLVDANDRYRQGDGAALDEIASVMRELVEFYPVHIAKEDRGFFKPALEYFTDDERALMLQDFDDFDRQLIHERYRLVVERLEQSHG